MNEFTCRWEVLVNCHNFDLERVAAVLKPRGYLLRPLENDGWYLSGPLIESESTAVDAQSRGDSILRIVNAVLLIRRRDFKPVNVGNLIRDGKTKTIAGLMSAHISIGFRLRGDLSDAGGQFEDQPPPYKNEHSWLDAAENDTAVQAVLNLYVSDRDNKYYRAFERIRDDVGGNDATRKLLGWSKPKYNKFTKALNAPRHEEPSRTPVLSLGEAEELAHELIQVWLDMKSKYSS